MSSFASSLRALPDLGFYDFSGIAEVLGCINHACTCLLPTFSLLFIPDTPKFPFVFGGLVHLFRDCASVAGSPGD